ncbi:hypothetical protein BRC77_01240 [Halobacteriales archaeon QH_8_64_26]|nr:MAG: hypothetical protein BRC77_01240 [Halobacteriales archaeon QH_8_64_26]
MATTDADPDSEAEGDPDADVPATPDARIDVTEVWPGASPSRSRRARRGPRRPRNSISIRRGCVRSTSGSTPRSRALTDGRFAVAAVDPPPSVDRRSIRP